MRIMIIYKVINRENNMVYIGSTTISVEYRKRDHIQKANNNVGHKFQKAISTYGADAFEWEQIDTASSLNELASKEKENIIKYNSKDEGYNSDNGGGFKKTIYQYSIEDGTFIKSYNSLNTASKAVDSSCKAISRACLSVNQTLGGYYWSYNYLELFIPKKDKRKKEVMQYDLDGNLIANYISASEASKQTGVNKTSIAKVCRGERNHAGSYIWLYK